MENCGVVIKSAQFDIQDPDGEYDLDMTVVKNRGILIALMKLVYGGEGEFVVGSCYKEKVAAGLDQVDREPFEIMVHPDISSWQVPADCFLVFEFKRTKDHEFLSFDMEALHCVRQAFRLEPPNGNREHRDSTVDEYFRSGSAKVSSLQVIELLQMLVALSSNSEARLESLEDERVHIVICTYRTIKDKENSPLVLEELTPRERRVAEKKLGFAPFHFSPANPTGRHRLRLNKVSERQIAIKLIELRESQMQSLKRARLEYNKHRGGPRPETERVMRNARFNGRRFYYTDLWKVPLQGVLEVDYVEVPSSPSPSHNAWIPLFSLANPSSFLPHHLPSSPAHLPHVTHPPHCLIASSSSSPNRMRSRALSTGDLECSWVMLNPEPCRPPNRQLQGVCPWNPERL